MKNELLQQKLSKLGLSENQSIIYLSLLKNGMSKSGRIPTYTGLKRGLCYKTLDQLVEFGLVKNTEKIQKLPFTPLCHLISYMTMSAQKKNEYTNSKMILIILVEY